MYDTILYYFNPFFKSGFSSFGHDNACLLYTSSDNACTKLIVKMPPTDSNGSSRVTLTKTQDTVYLKEITAPEGYVVQASSYGVKLVVGSTTKPVSYTHLEPQGL